jgi:hypothetical protein
VQGSILTKEGLCTSSSGRHVWGSNILDPCGECNAMIGSWVNLTPHVVVIHGKNEQGGPVRVTFRPSGFVARVKHGKQPMCSAKERADEDDSQWCNFPVKEIDRGCVVGLPPYVRLDVVGSDSAIHTVAETLYIVSALVAAHPDASGRADVFCPGDPVRNKSSNRVVGCRALHRVKALGP